MSADWLSVSGVMYARRTMHLRTPLTMLLALSASCGASPALRSQESPPPVVAAAASSAPPVLPAPELAAHIAGIERGLLPPVRVKGRDVRWTLEARMREHRVPGLGIAVFSDYHVVWARAYGFTDVGSGERVTDATLFQAGSISKPVTALAALEAVEKGLLALDAPINDALTSWKLPENDLTRATPVTLRRLLSHTAGTTVHGFPGYAAGEKVPTIVEVLDGLPPANTRAVRVDLAPGASFRYSGGGTSIVQLALIDRLRRPFPAILRDSVLAPLGMEQSTYEQPLPPDRVALAAAGHDSEGQVIPGKRHVYPEMAAAGLWTTPSDLARFFAELALALEGRSTHVSRALAAQMTTPVVSASDITGVGLGLFISTRNGATYFGHNGADEGFQAMAVARFGKGYGAVLMANSDNGGELFEEVKRAIEAEYAWDGVEPPLEPISVAAARLAALPGRFATGLVAPFTLALTEGRLELRRPFAEPAELIPVAADTFVALDDGTRYHIDADAREIGYARQGKPEKATRIADDVRVPLFELAAGRYEPALTAYRKLQREDPKSPALDEETLNRLGFDLMARRHDLPNAILVLRLNSALHPDAMNTYDSLAEAYARSGDKPRAIATFQAALAAMKRDKTTPSSFKEQLRVNAEKRLGELQGR